MVKQLTQKLPTGDQIVVKPNGTVLFMKKYDITTTELGQIVWQAMKDKFMELDEDDDIQITDFPPVVIGPSNDPHAS